MLNYFSLFKDNCNVKYCFRWTTHAAQVFVTNSNKNKVWEFFVSQVMKELFANCAKLLSLKVLLTKRKKILESVQKCFTKKICFVAIFLKFHILIT